MLRSGYKTACHSWSAFRRPHTPAVRWPSLLCFSLGPFTNCKTLAHPGAGLRDSASSREPTKKKDERQKKEGKREGDGAEWCFLLQFSCRRLRNDGRMRNDCENCCFFHPCSSTQADCLLSLTGSAAGRPQGILAGSPHVGERRGDGMLGPVIGSICQGWRLSFLVSLFCHCVPSKYLKFRAVAVYSHARFPSHPAHLRQFNQYSWNAVDLWSFSFNFKEILPCLQVINNYHFRVQQVFHHGFS